MGNQYARAARDKVGAMALFGAIPAAGSRIMRKSSSSKASARQRVGSSAGGVAAKWEAERHE